MKDKEVLQKAIEIATENNARWGALFLTTKFKEKNPGMKLNKEIQWMKSFIFSHDFAKAFWGEKNSGEVNLKRLGVGEYLTESILDWKYHLQQMVLEENPIDYLRKFVDNTRNSVSNDFPVVDKSLNESDTEEY